MSEQLARPRVRLASRSGIVLIGFLAVAGFFLATEHLAHLYGALPYLLLLAMMAVHLFHGHGHDHGGTHGEPGGQGGLEGAAPGPPHVHGEEGNHGR